MNLRSKYSSTGWQIISYDLSLWSTFPPGILSRGIVYEDGIKITPPYRVIYLIHWISQSNFQSLGLFWLELCAPWKPRMHGPFPLPWWATAQWIFSCVPSNRTNVCFLCVKSKSKEMLSMLVSLWPETFFLWKGRRHWGQVESTPLVFGI